MNKQILFWLAVPALAGLAFYSMASESGHARIDGKQAQSLVQAGARLVDVRTPSEFGTKHLPNAINIPVQQLGERMKELEPKDQPIVLYCRSGHRSGIAFDQLKGAGYSKLYDLGPMTAW